MQTIIRQLNWVDVFFLILSLRVCYAAMKVGFVAEFFKLLGTLCALYTSLHYYTYLSDWFTGLLHINVKEGTHLEFLDFVTFLLLAGVCYAAVASLRLLFTHFVKIEAVSKLNQAAGLVLGSCRVFLLLGLIAYLLAISSVVYLRRSVESAYSGRFFFRVATSTYEGLWNNLFSKCMPSETFNETVIETEESFK